MILFPEILSCLSRIDCRDLKIENTRCLSFDTRFIYRSLQLSISYKECTHFQNTQSSPSHGSETHFLSICYCIFWQLFYAHSQKLYETYLSANVQVFSEKQTALQNGCQQWQHGSFPVLQRIPNKIDDSSHQVVPPHFKLYSHAHGQPFQFDSQAAYISNWYDWKRAILFLAIRMFNFPLNYKYSKIDDLCSLLILAFICFFFVDFEYKSILSFLKGIRINGLLKLYINIGFKMQQHRSPGSSRHSNGRIAMNSPNSKPKKLVTRETTKTTSSHTQRISQTEIVKTSYTNTVSQVTQQFKHRVNLLKKTTKTNTINEIKQTLSQFESDPIHKYVKTIEHLEMVRENKDGKIRREKKTKQDEYEEIVSDDDEDEEIEGEEQSNVRLEGYQKSNIVSNIRNVSYPIEESNIELKGQSTGYQKASASMSNSRNASTIPMDYSKMLDKFMQKKPGEQADILKEIPDKDKIDFVKNLMNDPNFKKRNIIKTPYFSSEVESSSQIQ